MTLATRPRLGVITVLAASCLAPLTSAYISIPFNTTHYFGPDGPWQGVVIGVQYDIGVSPMQYVNLLPAPNFDTCSAWVLDTTACTQYENEDCGAGGAIAPPTYDQWDFYMTGPVSYNNPATGWQQNFFGYYAPAVMTLSPGVPIYEAQIGVANNSWFNYSTGIAAGQELGFFSLGGKSALKKNSPPENAYQDDLVQSNSFGLHIGAAGLQYPGSLILGGYDKGRIIGPVISSSPGQGGIQLKDITIGVEIGDTPPSLKSQSGLLLSEGQTATQPLPGQVYPDFPYISLPWDTVQALTIKLPVYLDDASGFFLWNTSNPSYSQIVSSPSYLGFVFPDVSSTVSNANITIKVPFALLNLTLQPAASGLNSDVPYLPIVNGGRPSYWQSDALVFGRAFLQAAFFGANWDTNVTWLAQAPGPGKTKQGLGVFPRELSASATTLEFESDESLFRQSWEGHWTPLGSTSPSASPTTSSRHHSNDLGGGAIAGIVVGIIALITLLGALVFFIVRRRRRVAASEQEVHNRASFTTASELDSPRMETRELHGKEIIQELPGRDY